MVRHVLQEAWVYAWSHRKGANDSAPAFGDKLRGEGRRVLLPGGQLKNDAIMFGEASQDLEEF